MITLHAEASALTVTAGLDDTMLVAGMANVASVQVTFSEDWTGLGKTLLFYNGDKTILHIMESDDEIVPIPHEVLAMPGRTLYVGVQGSDGERVILPTVRCKLKAVLASIDPDGDRETIPDKPQWEQMREDMAELAAEATAAAESIHTDAAAVQENKEAAVSAAASAAGDATAAAASAEAAAASAEAAQEIYDSIPPDFPETVQRTLEAFPQKKAWGNFVTIDDGAEGVPVAGMTVQLDASQSGSGDPSPDNIRPITGKAAVEIRRTGRNLWGGAQMLADIKKAVPAAAIDDEAGTATYNASAATADVPLRAPFKEKTAYSLVYHYANNTITSPSSYKYARPNIDIRYADGSNRNPIGTQYEANVPKTTVWVTPAAKTVTYLFKSNQSGRVTVYANQSGFFEGELTADDYEPYIGAVYAVSLPETVYGGVLDVTAGRITITHGLIESYDGEELPGAWISDRDVYAEGTAPTTGAQVVYALAEPRIVQLDPVTITTLAGVTNIWTDAGRIEVTYRAKNEPEAAEICDASANKAHIEAMSCGHVRYYDKMTGTPLTVYDKKHEALKTVDGSPYIAVKAGEIVNVLIGKSADISDKDHEFYLSFYRPDKSMDWDTLDELQASTGERNRFLVTELRTKCGLQLVCTSAGFVRMAPITGQNIRIAIWDGQRFGIPTAGYAAVQSGTDSPTVHKMADVTEYGAASVALPGYGDFAVAAPGYTFLRGYTGLDARSYNGSMWPTQVARLRGGGLYGEDSPKNLVIVKNYDYETGTWDNESLACDLSSAVVILDFTNTFSWQKPVTGAQRIVLDKINYLTDKFEWTPVRDTIAYTKNGTNYYFHAGTKYKGVPYKSVYSVASLVGWHVTKRTFLSAAADEDSVFYNGDASKGPWFSLVCSNWATLVTGFSYPMTNFGLMKDPNTEKHKAAQAVIGELQTNGYGHCVVPVGIYTAAEANRYAVAIAEEGDPASKYKVVYNGVLQSWTGVGSDSTYMDHYRICCAPNKHAANYQTPYDVETYTAAAAAIHANATARPYYGDCSVNTSPTAVKINIKHIGGTATELHVQKYKGITVSRGYPNVSEAAADGAELVYPITAGATYVQVPVGDLVNGGIYGVWTDLDASPGPSNIEFFEWRDRSIEAVHYSVTDGKLETQDVFWYCIAMGYNRENPYHPDKNSGLCTIPYEPPKRSIDPTDETIYPSDYSKYREAFYLYDSRGTAYTPVRAFFKKGTFGAFVMGDIRGSSPDPDPDPDPDPPEEDEEDN